MFTRDTVIALVEPITIGDRRPDLGDLAGTGAMYMVPTKGDQPQFASLSVVPGEHMELTTETGRRIKCAPRAKLMLPAGGFVYADESNGATVDTETGPERITNTETEGKTDDLVSVRLTSVHAVIANGFWFLVD